MLLVLLGLSGCGNKGTDSAELLNEQETGSNGVEDTVDPKPATEMFRIPNRPWDLALSSRWKYTLHLGSNCRNANRI